MADYTLNDLENWSYYQYPKLFLSQRSNAYLKNEYGDYVRDNRGKKIITHKVRKTSSYAEMSDKAKTLYMILFDRLCVSFKSNQALLDSGVSRERLDFEDENGATYIVFTNRDLMDCMDIKSENTVTKAKKELLKNGLLREQRMGVNKANRLYPQKLEASHQIIEWRDLETDEITDKFDWQGNQIYHLEKTVETVRLTGTVKNEAPKITVQEPQKVQSIKPNNNQPNNLDTYRYENENYFVSGVNHEFLSPKTVKELSLWGEDKARELQDIIFRTKRKVEKQYSEALQSKQLERISGELWEEDLEFEIIKFNAAYRKKDKKTQEKVINNPMGFFTTMLQKFWLAALTVELHFNAYNEIPVGKAFFSARGKTLLQGYFGKFDTELLKKAIEESKKEEDKPLFSVLGHFNWQEGIYIWSLD